MGKTVMLGLEKGDVDECVLPVFGEEAESVAAGLEAAGCALSPLGRRRGAAVFRAGREGTSFTVVVAGYGSAAVAGTMFELVSLGGRTFVLAGTCGASRHYPLGDTYLLTRAVINPLGGPGGVGFSSAGKPGRDILPSPDLAGIASGMGLKSPGEGRVISQDSFYNFGCVLDEGGQPLYAGPAPANGQTPPGFRAFVELYQSGEPYLLDMETAFFYALCRTWKGVRGIAVKSVANHVPFDPDDPLPREKEALFSSLRTAVELLLRAQRRERGAV